MNKKAIFSLAAALCVGASALAISACDNHKHTYDSELSSCGATGHWYAATCGHEIDGKDFAEHNYGNWVIDTAATEESTGTRHRTCGGCGYVENGVIAKLEHTHTYATELTSCGKAGHWYAATCGHEVDGKNFEAHNYGDWVVDKEEDMLQDGLRHRTCDGCGYVDEEVIPKHVHTYTDWMTTANLHWRRTTCESHAVQEVDNDMHVWEVEETPATATEGGHYKKYCKVCEYVDADRDTPPLGSGSSISPYTAVEGLNQGELDENAEQDDLDSHYHCWTYTATAAGVVKLEVADDMVTFLNISTESFEDAENFNYGEGNAIGVPDETNYCEINVSEGTTLYILVLRYDDETFDLGEYSFTLTFTPAA